LGPSRGPGRSALTQCGGVRRHMESRRTPPAPGDISPGDISDLQKCIARPSPPTLEPSEEKTDYCAARSASFGALSSGGARQAACARSPFSSHLLSPAVTSKDWPGSPARGGSRNCRHLSRKLCRHSPLWERSCDRGKRQQNKGGACHAATIVETIRYVETSIK